jgi:hypothetical protein
MGYTKRKLDDAQREFRKDYGHLILWFIFHGDEKLVSRVGAKDAYERYGRLIKLAGLRSTPICLGMTTLFKDLVKTDGGNTPTHWVLTAHGFRTLAEESSKLGRLYVEFKNSKQRRKNEPLQPSLPFDQPQAESLPTADSACSKSACDKSPFMDMARNLLRLAEQNLQQAQQTQAVIRGRKLLEVAVDELA